ncbi:MAG: hypothetical protein HY695_18195 [Deltaproteobacteria bacterium]|nr:hypothetical protein [Deltaproteobacteria bacterium]
MRRHKILLIITVVLGLLSGTWLVGAEAAGPWKGQIVDAETEKPLEGVVVLAVWYRRYASLGGWAGGGYYGSEEVVTRADGRFVIQSRSTWSLIPFSKIEGPEFYIFKPGYGPWRFRGGEEWLKLDIIEREKHFREAWKQFEGDGVVIELPPLKTGKQRLEALSHASPPGEIPNRVMLRYLEALDQEAVVLGLQPTGRGRIGREK